MPVVPQMRNPVSEVLIAVITGEVIRCLILIMNKQANKAEMGVDEMRGCSELRLYHCIAAWVTERDFVSKKTKK